MKKFKDIFYSQKFAYTDSKQDYEFQLKKRRTWWWLLLLLLPLLLLIKCKRDITVHTIDAESSTPVASVNVSLDYTAHYLFKSEPVSLQQVTDSTGTTVFKDLPYSVFSSIFYCLSKVYIQCESGCYAPALERHRFHSCRNVDVKLTPELVDLHVRVVDLETGDPIPDATVYYSYIKNGRPVTDSTTSNENGSATIPSFRRCSVVDSLRGSCYGYADTTKCDVPAEKMLTENDESTLRLRPIKKSFTFFVKNVETKEPIPGAAAVVTLTDSHSHVVRKTTRTNVDGKGRGFFDDAFILAEVDIKASKVHFHDSTLVGDYTVDQFRKLPDEMRIVWLRPDPFVEEFENRDTVTRELIPGVVNIITSTDPSGKVETYTEVSNRNGKFPVRAKADSKITIVSQKSPEYIEKTTEIPKFMKAETVWMRSNLVNLTFRTVEKESGDIIGNCNLMISTSMTGVTSPVNSGSGVFEVRGLLLDEQISIVASKTGYSTNDTKIRNANVRDLQLADQSRRDIPLEIDLPPCEGGNLLSRDSGAPLSSNASYNMGQRSGTFLLEVEAYSIPDHFVVLDGPDDPSSPVLFDGDIQDRRNLSLTFHHTIVTIKVLTSGDGSSWKYIPHCPK